MSKNISKAEQRIKKNIGIFHDLVINLNKSVEYIFVGFFANIGHNYFRSKSYIEILVSEDSYSNLYEIMLKQGFKYSQKEEYYEFYTDELLIKVRVSIKKEHFKGKKEQKVISQGREFSLFFPSLENHKKMLIKNNGFFGKEDSKILEQGNKESLDISNLFETYFYYMYINILHNHIEGSLSCPLCMQD